MLLPFLPRIPARPTAPLPPYFHPPEILRNLPFPALAVPIFSPAAVAAAIPSLPAILTSACHMPARHNLRRLSTIPCSLPNSSKPLANSLLPMTCAASCSRSFAAWPNTASPAKTLASSATSRKSSSIASATPFTTRNSRPKPLLPRRKPNNFAMAPINSLGIFLADPNPRNSSSEHGEFAPRHVGLQYPLVRGRP